MNSRAKWMRMAPLVVVLAGMSGCGGDGVEREVARPPGQYTLYHNQLVYDHSILQKRVGTVTGGARIAVEVALLAEHRDQGTAALVRGIAALMQKYRLPVDQALLQLPADYRLAKVEDVAWARELSLAMYDGSASGIGLPDDSPSRTGASEDLPAEFVVDLRELLLTKCPDRAVRLTVLLNPPQAPDVKKAEVKAGGTGLTEKDFAEKFRKEHATFVEFFDSLEDREDDPLNVSALEVYDKMQGVGFQTVMYYFAQSNVPATAHEVRDRGARLVAGSGEARDFDLSPRPQAILDRFALGVEKAKGWTNDLDGAVVEWNQQMPVVWEFLKALQENSKSGLAACSGAELNAALRDAPDLAGAVFHDAGAHDLEVMMPGLPRSSREEKDLIVKVTYRTAGEVLKRVDIHLVMQAEGEAWTVAGISGVYGSAE